MADTLSVQVAGAALIQLNTGASGALESLGYTMDSAYARFEGYFDNVYGDENGGQAGPPIEVLCHGEKADVRLELTRYDAAIADKVACRLKGATAGTPPSAGTLVYASGGDFRLVIASPRQPMNFPRAILRGSTEINKGTKHSTLILNFECQKDAAGVLCNKTVTGT
jgi:hypothetical protein